MMRSSLIVVLFLVGGVLPTAAQTALEGPLTVPDAVTATSAAARAKKPVKKRHHVAKDMQPRPVDHSAAVPRGPGVGEALVSAPTNDPISLGMKWQGNNDTAAQTRSQNLDGNAFGSGAELGMKLHF